MFHNNTCFFSSKNAEEDHYPGMLEHFDHCNRIIIAWIFWHRLNTDVIQRYHKKCDRSLTIKQKQTKKGTSIKNNAKLSQ